MKTISLLAGILILSAAASRATDISTTLTFDDLFPVEYVLIPNGYHGLQWNNFFIQNGLNAPGFYLGAISAPNVALNGLGEPASIGSGTSFTLHSAYLTAVYVDTQQIRAQGFTGGVLTYDSFFTANDNAPTLVNFNYEGVDQVRFSITTSPRGIFALDNLVITVPEPGTFALFGVAAFLGRFGIPGRKPKRRKLA